eukprot:365223-Chlamydomonas_euryale.AAC.7
MAAWLHGSMASKLNGCIGAVAPKVHGCMGAWLERCMAAWGHDSMGASDLGHPFTGSLLDGGLG